ncbi:unnamed protein product [Mycena citricolor]|uniref:Tyr recombinase domain-containing protein n=1 Tax=Mycena citricolor TaxID=2018698 RepID=A0AAD2H8V5_9AGAR|nr:unnamed protein product [Mycena citricolor]
MSVNSEINIDDFPCKWGSFSDIVILVIEAPPGTEAATLDVDADYRRCPIHPTQQPHFVVKWNGVFYIDHVCPFGFTSSGGIFGRVADAMAAIYRAKGIGPLKKWVDDFVFFCFPLHGSPSPNPYSLSDIYDVAKDLGWLWKQSKTHDFASEFIYLGFHWNITDKLVSIPDGKKSKYIARLLLWTPDASFTVKEAKSLLGTLVHCSLALPEGKSRLPAISKFAASFAHTRSPFSRRKPNATVLDDVSWGSWRLVKRKISEYGTEPGAAQNRSFITDVLDLDLVHPLCDLAVFTLASFCTGRTMPMHETGNNGNNGSDTRPRIFQQFYSHSPLPANAASLGLSQRTMEMISTTLQSGWARNTLSNMGGIVDSFLRYCDSKGVPTQFRLPADEMILCAYVASNAGKLAGTTIRNHISALKVWHVAQGADWNGKARLHYVLAGAERMEPNLAKKPPRPPINRDMLSRLHEGLDFSDPRNVAVYATTCTVFWGQCRLSEILPLSTSSKASAFTPKRLHFVPRSGASRTSHFRIPQTKTSIQGDTIHLPRQSAPLDPVTAIEMHFIASRLDSNTLLFNFSKGGKDATLTKSAILKRCNEIWSANGYPRTTGHSFRIGGTTELLLAGIHPDVVRTMGQWLSDSFLRYWRSLENLIPKHAEFLS